MADGFEIVFNTEFITMGQRLATFGEDVAKRVTLGALAETAKLMRNEARNEAHTSHAFIAKMLSLPKSERPFYINDDGTHILKIKNVYEDISSGNLKQNVKYGRINSKFLLPGELGYRVYIGKRVAWYAKFVEWGRHGMSARPFIRPAFEKNYDKLGNLLREGIARLIEKGGF